MQSVDVTEIFLKALLSLKLSPNHGGGIFGPLAFWMSYLDLAGGVAELGTRPAHVASSLRNQMFLVDAGPLDDLDLEQLPTLGGAASSTAPEVCVE